jgi:hypothetical protein
MTENFEENVANGVATSPKKRKYVSPEIEVINIDEQPRLLADSFRSFKSGFADEEEDEI